MADLQCAVCGKEYPLELRYRCQACDNGVLNVVYSSNQAIRKMLANADWRKYLVRRDRP